MCIIYVRLQNNNTDMVENNDCNNQVIVQCHQLTTDVDSNFSLGGMFNESLLPASCNTANGIYTAVDGIEAFSE